MSVLLTEFEDRAKEVEIYFQFLRLVIVEKASLTHGLKKPKVIAIDGELAKILKANAFLLLYNLVESSIRDGLRRIYEAILNRSQAAKDGLSRISSFSHYVASQEFGPRGPNYVLAWPRGKDSDGHLFQAEGRRRVSQASSRESGIRFRSFARKRVVGPNGPKIEAGTVEELAVNY
jgi:hypothetical protein